ncbi:MAG TPA: nucleotidyl transferase AbiEii/AbiGii toxin family protein [Blastocatellia bacterium]|jgi:predicted nucleotidyltransferase
MAALIESDNQTFYEVLDEALAAVDKTGIPYVLMGGIATTARGGHRFTHDIDMFCKPLDAEKILEALAQAGFRTEKTFPEWLYKGFKNDVMVDVIFQSSGPVFLEDEMMDRSTVVDFNGRPVRTLSPEDLFIIKALVLNEHTLAMDKKCMRHLHDLLSIIRMCELDWDYLLKRARRGPRRVLGLLLYAQSLDLLVPDKAIKSLIHMLEFCQ